MGVEVESVCAKFHALNWAVLQRQIVEVKKKTYVKITPVIGVRVRVCQVPVD